MKSAAKKALAKTIATKQFSKPLGIVKMPRGATFRDKKNDYNRQSSKKFSME